MTDRNATAMPRQRENLQRAHQLDQDVHPTGSSNSTRNSARRPRQIDEPFFRKLRTDVTALLRAIQADVMTLLRGRPSEITALVRQRLADLYALPLWEKFYWGSGIIVWLLICLRFVVYVPSYPTPSEMKRHCTSEWIFDTAAPYHTTNQQCAFADYSTHYYEGHLPTRRFDSPATYKGVESHGYGTVKLDLQYQNPKVQNATSVKVDRRYSYAPLELHFAQLVPKQANTISVSQLMHTNDGIQIPNKAMVIAFENRVLGLRIGNGTDIPAEKIRGHYVLRARVPSRACECPDLDERGIFKVSEIDYSTTKLNYVIGTNFYMYIVANRGPRLS